MGDEQLEEGQKKSKRPLEEPSRERLERVRKQRPYVGRMRGRRRG